MFDEQVKVTLPEYGYRVLIGGQFMGFISARNYSHASTKAQQLYGRRAYVERR